jgi:hypothetical protein
MQQHERLTGVFLQVEPRRTRKGPGGRGCGRDSGRAVDPMRSRRRPHPTSASTPAPRISRGGQLLVEVTVFTRSG